MPDIRTVAAVAKVSIATVSRTINGSPLVSERLSKRVWQAIKQLNYFPNTHARTLVSGRSRLLGIIVENITNPFFPELIQSFEQIAVAHGYEILVSSSNSDPALLTTCVRRMLERKVEGVAVMTFGEEESVLDELTHRNVPIVLAEFKLDDPEGEHDSAGLLDGNAGGGESPGRAWPQAGCVSSRAAQPALGADAGERFSRRHAAGRIAAGDEVCD